MKAALLLLALSLTGCVYVSGTRTGPDGSKLTISSTRLLWVSENMTFSTMTDDGVLVELKATKSSSDGEAVAALAEIAKGAVVK